MASAASVLQKRFLALRCHRSFGAAGGEPVLVIGFVHRRSPPDHSRMLRAAVLRAEDVIPAGFGSCKPQRIVVARHYIVLYPKRRDKEAVDDILGSHSD